MPSITCGKCGQTHGAVEIVRACAAGNTFPCPWLVDRGYNEDGESVITECEALAWGSDRGFECEAGHGHVYAEVRVREGWEYAEDRDEAAALAKVGVMPVQMDGSVFV
jgi:hypothetical protein